ncbi:MAG: DUF1294 domain-containing protein [bacterium]|nr:DUF1294 domain-containing protein [Candidatus Limimorpha equi]
MLVFFFYIIVMNVVAFHMYRIDKQHAERGEYRISEAALLAVSFLGGALGAFCAMHEYRHKTLHTSFAVGVPLALLVQTVLVVWAMVYCLITL